MHCLDCAMNALDRDAVAVCAHCGAGVCLDHAVVVPHRLTRPAVLLRQDPVDPARPPAPLPDVRRRRASCGCPGGQTIRSGPGLTLSRLGARSENRGA